MYSDFIVYIYINVSKLDWKQNNNTKTATDNRFSQPRGTRFSFSRYIIILSPSDNTSCFYKVWFININTGACKILLHVNILEIVWRKENYMRINVGVGDWWTRSAPNIRNSINFFFYSIESYKSYAVIEATGFVRISRLYTHCRHKFAIFSHRLDSQQEPSSSSIREKRKMDHYKLSFFNVQIGHGRTHCKRKKENNKTFYCWTGNISHYTWLWFYTCFYSPNCDLRWI